MKTIDQETYDAMKESVIFFEDDAWCGEDNEMYCAMWGRLEYSIDGERFRMVTKLDDGKVLLCDRKEAHNWFVNYLAHWYGWDEILVSLPNVLKPEYEEKFNIWVNTPGTTIGCNSDFEITERC